MRGVRAYLLFPLALVLLTGISGCKKGDKYAEYALDLAAALEECSFQAQDAVSLSFEGEAASIPKAAEQLYIAMRRSGRYFGGPLILLLRERPDWEKGILKGDLLFPLAPGEGAQEYLDRDISGVTSTERRFAGGRYNFVRYHGPLEALEAGYARLESFVRGFNPGECALVFEDTLRDIEKRYHVRIMARTGD